MVSPSRRAAITGASLESPRPRAPVAPAHQVSLPVHGGRRSRRGEAYSDSCGVAECASSGSLIAMYGRVARVDAGGGPSSEGQRSRLRSCGGVHDRTGCAAPGPPRNRHSPPIEPRAGRGGKGCRRAARSSTRKTAGQSRVTTWEGGIPTLGGGASVLERRPGSGARWRRSPRPRTWRVVAGLRTSSDRSGAVATFERLHEGLGMGLTRLPEPPVSREENE
jgi:hypothetical protein